MKATFRLDLEPDQQRVRFRINERPSVDFRFDAAGLDALIVRLGKIRAQMEPAHNARKEPRPPRGTEYTVVEGNGVSITHDGAETILHLNDPRYGWLHYSMSKTKAASVANYLQIEPARIAPPQASEKPN